MIGVMSVLLLWAHGQVHAQSTPSPSPTPTAATPTPTPRGSYILPADINVRGGPSETFPSVGRLAAGNVVRPLNRSADGRWVLIAYNRGFAWVRRDLAFWAVDIDELPVLDIENLTPTREREITPFFATNTPDGNWVFAGENGARLRAGPGLSFPVLDRILDGELVEPVGRDAETEWILIRRAEGFAWIARVLVQWDT
ncbi:MAG: hypothetical protein CUN53_11290, partial [Phototrophicales bacterium]